MNKNERKNPLVSISCAAYNHENCISKAIEGFLMQKTDFPIEILIHDDASTDKTVDIIESYRQLHPELIKTIYQKENQYSQGVFFSYKYTWPKAKGKYIALCDGDDYWTDPNKLQKQIEFLENNPSFTMCYTDFSIINDEGEILKKNGIGDRLKKDISYLDMLSGGIPKSSTIVFRKAMIPKEISPMANKEDGINGDMLLYPMIAKNGPAHYMDFVSTIYVNHGRGRASSMNRQQTMIRVLKSKIILKEVFNSEHEKELLDKVSRRIYIDLLCCFIDDYIETKNIKGIFDSKDWDKVRLEFSNILGIEGIDYDFLNLQHNSLVGKKIYVFGAGSIGKKVLKILPMYKIECSGLIDNDVDKHGDELDGVRIFPFDELQENENIYILVASSWSEEISEQLKKEGLKERRDYQIL